MHLVATSSSRLDEIGGPVDLGQAPADVAVLSFSDSDLAAFDAAFRSGAAGGLTLRLTALGQLSHPMSVDLWLDRVARHARVVLVRLLGGYEAWRYGCDALAALAVRTGLVLVLLPGECRVDDERLAALSQVEAGARAALLAALREGGAANVRKALARLAALGGGPQAAEAEAEAAAEAVPRCGFWRADTGVVGADADAALPAGGGPVVLVVFYRSQLLAGDAGPVGALCAALEARGLRTLAAFVPGLRDEAAAEMLRALAWRLPLAVAVTTTAFAGAAEGLFAALGVPLLQAVMATTLREGWEESDRGLGPADLAMHVVLPELDGRVLAGAIAFKECEGEVRRNRTRPDRVAQVADRVAALVRLQQTPRAQRRLVMLLPDYPHAPGRTGYAVGLDVPMSALAILHDLKDAGYDVADIPPSPRALMAALSRPPAPGLTRAAYERAFGGLAQAARARVLAAWGAPAPAGGGDVFRFRALACGQVTIALAPDRGQPGSRRADYHDPALPPGHDLLAFGFWLRGAGADGEGGGDGCHALIHLGAHGTLEWLPGKTVALSQACFPEIVTGALPVVYPFIVSNPGEAAQAKRRLAAVTLGHLTPPLIEAGLDDGHRALEQLVDEFAAADGLDRRRRDRLARLIVETARESGLAAEAGVTADADADTALMRIDAWLCDLKEAVLKDGQHIYGRAAAGDGALRRASAAGEREGLLRALDGRPVDPGPAGAPARGRVDVMPTGRNLFAADPRTLPTPTSFALGRQAAEEVVRCHLQAHGDWPRALVMDLYGSASLRTGGEDIAQGLALMGCRPVWDAATGRVSGIEVLPPAATGRPRVDVTWRISGLFRDLFPGQIALLDAAVAAVAARGAEGGDNPLAAAAAGGAHPQRIFGSPAGAYGSGIEPALTSGAWQARDDLGRDYLAAASHAFGGAEGTARAAPGAFAARVAAADLLLHGQDDPGRDLLEGVADVAFIGGFSAALTALGRSADVVVLDTTRPDRPCARPLAAALARVVRARAVNPRFIAGQMRHGPRGAAEFAETVDRLVGFAETTDAVPPELIAALHEAYVADAAVRDFILEQNPAAAAAIAARLRDARRRGLWQPRRNAVDGELESLAAAAGACLAGDGPDAEAGR